MYVKDQKVLDARSWGRNHYGRRGICCPAVINELSSRGAVSVPKGAIVRGRNNDRPHAERASAPHAERPGVNGYMTRVIYLHVITLTRWLYLTTLTRWIIYLTALTRWIYLTTLTRWIYPTTLTRWIYPHAS